MIRRTVSVANPVLGWIVLILAIISAFAAILSSSTASGANDKTNRAVRELKASNVRLTNDESCLRSVVAALTTRNAVLSKLNNQRNDADKAVRAWTEAQQRVFQQALRGAHAADVRRNFTHANSNLLRAEKRWRTFDQRYKEASQRFPVPKIRCSAGHLDQPAPVVTKTRTTTGPPVRVPGPTRTVTRVVPGPTVTKTVTALPGKRHRSR